MQLLGLFVLEFFHGPTRFLVLIADTKRLIDGTSTITQGATSQRTGS